MFHAGEKNWQRKWDESRSQKGKLVQTTKKRMKREWQEKAKMNKTPNAVKGFEQSETTGRGELQSSGNMDQMSKPVRLPVEKGGRATTIQGRRESKRLVKTTSK